MSTWCSFMSKSTWIKLTLIALFVLVNGALYIKYSHISMDTAFPQLFTNRTVLFTSSSSSNSTDTGSNNSTTHSTTYSTTFSIFSPQTTVVSSSSSSLVTRRFSTPAYVTRKSELDKPFLRESIVNPHDFSYVITPNRSCSNREVELVICVPISESNYEGRAVIRNTWGSYANNTSNKALLVFFLGSKLTKHNSTKQRDLLEESLTYGDILQENYIDSYSNLSLKSVSILKWVSQFCPQTKFIVKADDDMYVNIPFLIKTLRERASDKSVPSAFVIGTLQVNAHPIRSPSSKWYTPLSMFRENAYPNYVSGTTYAMTSDAAYLLYEASLRVPLFWLEDIYITGLCARKAGVDVYNSGYFTYGKPKASGCVFRQHISGHRYSHQEIMRIHKELYDPNIKC